MRLLLLVTLFLSSPALGNQLERQFEFQGGMNHTYLRPHSNSNTQQSNLPPTQNEQAPTTKVWEKYKALAAGKAEPQPKEQQPTAAAAPEPQKQPTGMAAILQQYQANKVGRSQMRSISIARPEAPSVEAPKVPTTPTE